MSTRTQRQSSLSSLSEAKQIVDGIPLGQVDPKQVVQVARRVYEGGGSSGASRNFAFLVRLIPRFLPRVTGRRPCGRSQLFWGTSREVPGQDLKNRCFFPDH